MCWGISGRKNWATEHNPERKEMKKRKEWPGKEGETVRDGRRRGEAHVKSFLSELHRQATEEQLDE